ncbi:MAG: hypothetical protein ACLQKK_05340 [Rhodomicrobium sp.]
MSKSRFLVRLIAATASIAILSAASHAEQKTAKACETEWKANKAAIQGSGKTKKAFMVECRSGTEQRNASRTAPTTAPAQPQENTAPAAPAPRTAKRSQRATTISTGAGEYATEMEANAHCPGATVVWANTRSKIYHFAGTRAYGNTKAGAYMCEKDTASAGFRSAKNEKRR